MQLEHGKTVNGPQRNAYHVKVTFETSHDQITEDETFVYDKATEMDKMEKDIETFKAMQNAGMTYYNEFQDIVGAEQCERFGVYPDDEESDDIWPNDHEAADNDVLMSVCYFEITFVDQDGVTSEVKLA